MTFLPTAKTGRETNEKNQSNGNFAVGKLVQYSIWLRLLEEKDDIRARRANDEV